MRYEATFEGFRIPAGDGLIKSHNTTSQYRAVVEQARNGRWRCYMIGGGELGMCSKNQMQAKIVAESNFIRQVTDWEEIA